MLNPVFSLLNLHLNFRSLVNGVCDELQSLGVEGRPVSLFQCQVFITVLNGDRDQKCSFTGVTFQGVGERLER